jgi:AcrR family transcriptional regulator
MSTLKGELIRWGMGTRSNKSSEARARLLDAAVYCYKRLGASASISDIAVQARISRPTVYRYFSSHQEILKAVVRREVDKFWVNLHNELKGVDNFGDYLVEALVYTLKRSEATEISSLLLTRDILPIMNEIFLSDRDYLIEFTESMRAIYERLKVGSSIRQDLDLMVACEWFNRLAISYLATPSPFYQSEDDLRSLFKAMVASMLEQRA